MTREFHRDAGTVGRRAAEVIAAEANAAVAARGRFVLALSRMRPAMLEGLVAADIPWTAVHVVQVDERTAPRGHADRNLTAIAETLLSRTALVPAHLHPMPVNDVNLGVATAAYGATLREVAGTPPVVDLVHLGLGPDGHTASLLPGSPVLDIDDRDVAMTEVHEGWRRMTVTFPLLNRARRIVWVVTGPGKADALGRLVAHDASIPAGRVRADDALLLAERAT